jgi:hypothetical protein
LLFHSSREADFVNILKIFNIIYFPSNKIRRKNNLVDHTGHRTTLWYPMVYNISCECGRSYNGETGRPLAVRLREHRHNLREGLQERSKLSQHAYELHRVGWDEARIFEIVR